MRRIVGTRTIDDGTTAGSFQYVDNYGQGWVPHSGTCFGTGEDVRTVGPHGVLGYAVEYTKPKEKPLPSPTKPRRKRGRERKQRKGRGR